MEELQETFYFSRFAKQSWYRGGSAIPAPAFVIVRLFVLPKGDSAFRINLAFQDLETPLSLVFHYLDFFSDLHLYGPL